VQYYVKSKRPLALKFDHLFVLMSKPHICLPAEAYQALATSHRIAPEPDNNEWITDFDDCVIQSSKWTGTGNYQYRYWFNDLGDDDFQCFTEPVEAEGDCRVVRADDPCDNCRACMTEYFNSPPPVPFETCVEARATGMAREQMHAETAGGVGVEVEVEVKAAGSRYGNGPFNDKFKLRGNGCFEGDLEEAHEDDVFRGWQLVEVEVEVDTELGPREHFCLSGKVVTETSRKSADYHYLSRYTFYYGDSVVTINDSPSPSCLQPGDCGSYFYFKENGGGAEYHWFNRGDAETYIKVKFSKKLIPIGQSQ
jgi:hypothetical protein